MKEHADKLRKSARSGRQQDKSVKYGQNYPGWMYSKHFYISITNQPEDSGLVNKTWNMQFVVEIYQTFVNHANLNTLFAFTLLFHTHMHIKTASHAKEYLIYKYCIRLTYQNAWKGVVHKSIALVIYRSI